MNFGIIVAGGKSERMGPNVDKVFLSLGTRPVLAYSLIAFEKCPDIDGIVLVVRKDHVESARSMVQIYGCHKVRKVVAGGAKRQTSVANGLAALDLDGEDVGIVAVHDGARPCVTPDLISATIASAKRYGSGVAACKINDTIKQVDKGRTVSKTVDRTKLWAVQTPQSFKLEILRKAFESVRRRRLTITDEAAALEAARQEVRLVPSSWSNMKVTEPDDLVLAATLLKIS